jgi:16S rRNA (uracil1498-N3)-methyltransferase
MQFSIHTCRCFVDGGSLEPGGLELSADEARHVTKVRRMGVGSPVAVLNGRGELAAAVITGVGKNHCQIEIESVQVFSRPELEVTLVIGGLKQSAWDEMLLHAVELGVGRIIRVQSEHAVSDIGGKADAKTAKWRDRMIQACKQCTNPWLPSVYLAANVAEVSEWMTGPVHHLLASLGEGARPVGQTRIPATGEVACWIGPEGDFSEVEQQEIVARFGADRISLGPRILRAETAALALLSSLRLGSPQGFLHDIAPVG